MELQQPSVYYALVTPPSTKTILFCFTSAYLAAYYMPDKTIWLAFIAIGLLLLLLLLGQALRIIKSANTKKITWSLLANSLKYGSYVVCVLLGFMSGQVLQRRAEPLQHRSSLGMAAEKVQVYYGKVLRDAIPSEDGRFRFTLQLFATGDGKQLVSSAYGRVFVRAAQHNPMPSLGQLVAVRASIKQINFKEVSSGQRKRPSILVSRPAPKAIELYEPQDFLPVRADVSANSSAIANPDFGRPKALAYQAYNLRVLPSNPLYSWLGSLVSQLGDRLGIAKFLPFYSLDWTLFWQKLWQQRGDLRNKLFSSLNRLFPDAGRDLFLALLFGVSEDLPEQVKENFRRSGASHILALSGFHVDILASITSFLLRPLLGLRRSLLASSLILVAYLCLVGPLPSLTRAVFMFLLLSGCKFFLRRGDGFTILATSALLQTQMFPTAARTLSFQLSYAALLGLILFAGRSNTLALIIHQRLLSGMRFGFLFRLLFLPSRFIFQGIAVTLAVLLCSAPILIANFGQIQWIGLFASLVETPIITLYMWLSLLFWPLAYLLQNYEALLAPLQTAYRQLYHASLAPMEFFAQVEPWQFQQADGQFLIGPLLLYFLLNGCLLALLYRYELSYFFRHKLRLYT